MADHTVAGLVTIALIVIIASVFLAYTPEGTNLAGEASFQGAGESCEPTHYCDGSKLVLIKSDCSIGYAYCQYGCNPELAVCR